MTNPSLAWIERIHARLLVRYGARWLNLWSAFSDDDMAVVRQDWANVLHRFSAAAIEYGLENLSADNVPNAQQFADICRRMPARGQQPLIDAQPLHADPERTRALVEQVQAAFRPDKDRLAWARALRDREKDGDPTLTILQKADWRLALREGTGGRHGETNENFRGVDPNALPPGMRSTA